MLHFTILCRIFRGRSGLLTGFAGCGVLRGLQAPPRLQSSQEFLGELHGCGVAFRARGCCRPFYHCEVFFAEAISSLRKKEIASLRSARNEVNK